MPVSRYRLVFTVLIFTLIPAISRAAVLNNNSGLLNGGGSTTPPTGAVFTSVTTPFVTADLSGSITTDVYANDSTNPYGGLTFVYSIVNSSASTDAIGRATFTPV